MWFLLIIFLSPGILNDQELHRYATAEECFTERNRIGYEMASAYPWEHTFNIVCRYQASARPTVRT
jgi:hypothetical protein